MIELSLRKNNEEVMKYFLNKEMTTIGRSSSNDICLPDPSISRVHLAIFRKGDQFTATDKSTNGLFVNNERITSCVLEPNDVIRIGGWTIHVGVSQEAAEAETHVSHRDPTRVLSFRPAKNELVFERAVL